MRIEGFLGIDVGGSRCKATLVGTRGTVVPGPSVRYPTRRRPDGEVTQRPSDWEKALAAAASSCLQRSQGTAVLGLALTAPAHAVVLVGADGRPLAPALTAQDARPDNEARRLVQDHGDEIFATTMVSLTSGWSLAQLSWIATSRPELVDRTRWIMPVKDYLRFQLTGEASCDPSDAAGTGLYDPVAGVWRPELADLSGFPQSCLPPVLPPTDIGGRLGRPWAHRMGLPTGTPVAVGATDTAAELVSIGARAPGTGMIKIGSTGLAVGVSSEPRPSRGTFTYPHLDPGLWYSVAVTSTAGTSYEWLRTVLSSLPGRSNLGSFATMDKLASQVPPGSDGLLFFPYLEGERSPHWLRDLRGAFIGLSSSHTAGHLCRAVMEGVAMSVRHCVGALDHIGVAPLAPVISGGGADSELWRRILAAVLGSDCQRISTHSPAAGSAAIAAEAVAGEPLALKAKRQAVRPPPTWATAYEERFRSYDRVARELVNLRAEYQAQPEAGGTDPRGITVRTKREAKDG